jgi:phosphatidylglycerophosphatase A
MPPEPNALGPAVAPAGAERLNARFMLRHPAHFIALGLGSGLAPRAPGTAGTLFAWACFALLNPWLGPTGWAWGAVLVLSLALGVWACTLTAQHLGIADPGAIVWDEIVAFWLVLWVISPATWWQQVLAFALFRFFDAAKPGPVGWADRLHKLQAGQAIGWRQGWGILLDDLVAALCSLMVLALVLRFVTAF